MINLEPIIIKCEKCNFENADVSTMIIIISKYGKSKRTVNLCYIHSALFNEWLNNKKKLIKEVDEGQKILG